MRTKLKWYAETQALLDRDALTLKKKEEEINELKETVARLQAQHGQTVAEKKQKGVERATDAKRIQDLERQVKERFMRFFMTPFLDGELQGRIYWGRGVVLIGWLVNPILEKQKIKKLK